MSRTTQVIKNRDKRELIVQRTMPLPRTLAWRGWTKPEHIEKWWGPISWTATVYAMDVRPEGIWKYSMTSDDGEGEPVYGYAVYQEVVDSEKLVYIDSFADANWDIVEGSDMHTTVTFEEVPEGTRLVITTRFADAEQLEQAEDLGMIEGFTDAFDRLENYLERLVQSSMKTIISKDGTRIAYNKKGSGPLLVIVSSAAADHADTAQLADLLAEKYSVINYDRRGRGQSSDTAPYAVDKEIEDIEALIDAEGGSASLFGSSSGAVLALEAANKLVHKVSKLYMYEPPMIVNDGRPPVPANYVQHLDALIEEGKRNEAVEYFMTAAVGVPEEFVAYMKADPSWEKMVNIAHTLAYDGRIMSNLQQGTPLPQERWLLNIPTNISVGENSDPFFHDAAKQLSELLPNGEYHVVSGQDHSAVMAAPEVMSRDIERFIGG